MGNFLKRKILRSVGGIDRYAVGQQLLYTMRIDRILLVNKRISLRCRKFQYGRFRISRNDIAFILRVERTKLFDVDPQHIGNLLQVKHAVHHNRIGRQRQTGLHRANIMIAIVIHDIIGCDKQRYIRTGFTRQVAEDLPKIGLSPGTADRLVHIARTTVIGSQHQVPVAIDGVHIFKILTGRLCRLLRITPFIQQAVDLQTIYLAGRKHELP